MTSEALSSIRTSLARWQSLELDGSAQVLPLGISALDAALPGGGLTLGGVTELQIRGASGVGTSFALAACRAAQQLGDGQRENRAWCAFIDPGASLFAPGMARLGVDLSRLLVLRPPADAIERVAVRIAGANLMALLIIDLRHLAQSHLAQSHLGQSGGRALNEHSWQRTVRRLSLCIKSSSSSVLLLTQAEQFQSLPLPTLQRLELTRKSLASFELKVAKERTGRVSAPRLLACSSFDLSNFSPAAHSSDAASSSTGSSNTVQRPAPSQPAIQLPGAGGPLARGSVCGWEPDLPALARKVS